METERRVEEVRRVMVAIDENEDSLYALEWALKNLYESFSKSQLVVFTVQPSSDFSYLRVLDITREFRKDVEENHKRTADALLDRANAICHKYGVTPETITEVGEPKEAIRAAVEKHDIHLLVVANKGREGIKRRFLGGVSNYLVHKARCPVLVVKKSS